VGFISAPLPLVDITASVDQSTVKTCHIVLPVAFIETAIWPDLAPPTLSDARSGAPLARIASPIGKSHFWSVLQHRELHLLLFSLTKVVEGAQFFYDALDEGLVEVIHFLRAHLGVGA